MLKKFSFLLFLVLLATVGFAQKGTRHERIKAFKVSFITRELDLTPEEAQKFWPLYNRFEKERKALNRGMPKRGEIRNMSDKELDRLLDLRLQQEEKRIALKRQFINELRGFLPVRKIVRLQFAEKKFKRELVRRARERRGMPPRKRP